MDFIFSREKIIYPKLKKSLYTIYLYIIKIKIKINYVTYFIQGNIHFYFKLTYNSYGLKSK